MDVRETRDVPSEPTGTATHFWQQPLAERTLRIAVERGRLASSYLLTGPEGVGKWSAAQWVAKALLCTGDPKARPCHACSSCARVDGGSHPDWHALFPVPTATIDEDLPRYLKAKKEDSFTVVRFEKKPNISLERIRDLLTELSKTAVEGGAKAVIIATAEQIDPRYQPILLKSIEEPPPGAHFVVTSNDPGRLLPTIHSRCQRIRFSPVDSGIIARRLTQEFGCDPAEADLVAQLCGGGWGNALRLIEDKPREWRQSVLEFWREAFSVPPGDLMRKTEPLCKKRGFDNMMQAFDIWGVCLGRDTARALDAGTRSAARDGAPIRDLETAWACWRTLANGRSTLFVNVLERSAVIGTFLALRRRLGCL